LTAERCTEKEGKKSYSGGLVKRRSCHRESIRRSLDIYEKTLTSTVETSKEKNTEIRGSAERKETTFRDQ
jgi:hypothetical protein